MDAFDEIQNIPASGAQRLAEGFGMALPWNIFLLRTPALKDFSCQCRMAKGIDPKEGSHFVLYFHYDDRKQVSGALDLICTAEAWTGKIGVLKNHQSIFTEPEITWPAAGCSEWIFEVRGKSCTFAGKRFTIPAGVPGRGRIGFAHRVHDQKYEFTCLQYVKVVSAPVKCHPVFARKTWEMPQRIFNSMSPWLFSLEAAASENAVCLRAAVEGGPVNVVNHGLFCTKHLGNEYIENPYFQIVHPDGRVEAKQYIFYGKIGFHEHWATVQPAIPAADAECPVEQKFYLKELPPGSRIIIGFEKMRSEDRQHLSECGREMIVDPFKGKLLGARKMDRGIFLITVDSGADKEICRMIPETVVDYEKALDFARNNHFFFENETCTFEVAGELPSDYCSAEELSLRITLENVFKEPLGRKPDITVLKTDNSVFPKTRRIQYVCRFGKLPAGVYHLRTELMMNGELLAMERTAFESMSRKKNSPSAPEISGLPVVFSAHTDFESGTNTFDPRGEGSCNSTHYTAVSGMQIFFAEERREWELLKLYRRRLFSWYMNRSTNDTDVLHHLNSAVNSGYVASQQAFGRFHANDINSYTARNRKILAEFLVNKGDLPMAEEAGDMNKTLSLGYVEKLLTKYGIEWPAYIASVKKRKRDAVILKWIAAGVDPKNLCGYSFAPYYVTHTGVAFTALRYGHDLRDPRHPQYSAFSLAEDYPHLCSYPMICGCFTIANLKLDMPDLNLWPEVYGITGIPLDQATVANHLPSGAMESEIYAKRFYDLKFRTCWFRDGGFHFWQDDGFHLHGPSEKEFNILLDAWRIIRKWKPARPLRSMAVVGGAECILKHRPVAEIKQFALTGDFLDFYNTAEDFPAFVYLSTRLSGLPNGFAVRACEIGKLKPQEVSTLVLPPMDCFTAEEKDSIRQLFEAGVNIVSSEIADGLEDLFGVKKCEPHPVRRIGDETTNSEYNPVRWKPGKNVKVLLKDRDEVPLLTMRRGKSGAYAVFFTFAPTAFHRSKVTAAEASSRILSEAIDRVFRIIENDSAEVTVSKGRINAFRDVSGDLIVMAMEDAHPLPGTAITPLLTVKGDLRNCRIESDARFSIVERSAEKTLIRLHLEPEEIRYFHFSKIAGTGKSAVLEKKGKNK